MLEVDGDTVWLVPDLDELEHLAMYRFTAAAVLAPEPAPKKVTVLATGELYLG